MSCYLSDFQVIRPRYELPQKDLLHWIAHAHAFAEAEKQNWAADSGAFRTFHQEIEERFLKLGLGEEKIQKRGIELEDVTRKDWEEMKIYALAERAEGRGIKERTQFFDEAATRIFTDFYPERSPLPSHLIHVTCTGYASPSGAQKLVSQRGYGDRTVVTHAYHMGCYASIPALRMARGFGGADIVHTEICSLHMNPLFHTTEQLVVQSLFADGYIKYSVQAGEKIPGSLEICALHEEIISDSTESMSWRVEDWGMRMTIAKEVPVLVSRALPSFLQKLTQNKLLKNPLFAIHPGGPKIIQQVGEILKLEKAQLAHSQEILQSYGNMSSATLPHIWESIVRDEKVLPGTPIVSLAFGPGLTISGALFIKRGN